MQDLIEQLTGSWQGVKTLYTNWQEVKEHKSDCSWTWRPILNATALSLSYAWQHEQKTQQGEMLLAYNADQQLFWAAWLDSWHQTGQPMILQGKRVDAVVQLSGSFGAGAGEPDWGWRIDVFPTLANVSKIEMYVQPPADQGAESLAVVIESQG